MANHGVPDLSYVDSVRFFESVATAGKCPMCSTNSWSIAIRSDDHKLCFLQLSGTQHSTGPAYNLNLDCNKCGFVRLHRAHTIIAWLEQNPADAKVGQ